MPALAGSPSRTALFGACMFGLRHLNWSGVLMTTAAGSSVAEYAAIWDPRIPTNVASAKQWTERAIIVLTSLTHRARGSVSAAGYCLDRSGFPAACKSASHISRVATADAPVVAFAPA